MLGINNEVSTNESLSLECSNAFVHVLKDIESWKFILQARIVKRNVLAHA